MYIKESNFKLFHLHLMAKKLSLLFGPNQVELYSITSVMYSFGAVNNTQQI